jgi:DNA-binding transcriptional LysR family regulator
LESTKIDRHHPRMDGIPWQDVELFLAVAESGSFSEAARRLRLGQATVSRRIAQLEDQLGEALFQRGVEGAIPTATAARLLPAARRMAEAAGELTRTLATGEPTPSGVVRIAAPPGVAWDFLVPFAAALRGPLPELRIEVRASIAHVDLGRHEADLALRNRPPTQGELVDLAQIRVPVGIFAHPELVAALPPEPGVGDLPWVCWAPPYDRLPPRPQLEAAIPGFEPRFTSDDFLVLWRAAELGLGAMFLGGTRHRFRRDTTLVRAPIELGVTDVMHLVTAKALLRVPRVRAVLDALLDELTHLEGARVEVDRDLLDETRPAGAPRTGLDAAPGGGPR